MATLTQNRDERGNAISSYYNNLMTYNSQTLADGTDSDADKPQAKFKAFNDLIKLHHDELKVSVGYASASGVYLPSDEGALGTGEWWANANVNNATASLFYNDSTIALPANKLYVMNGRSGPYQRHPYMYWNQSNSILGSPDDYGWANADPTFTYTDTLNPFETGTSYRLKEPLENYGDADNLLWKKIVWDGRWSYRARYCRDSSYSTHEATGLNNYERAGASIGEYVVGSIDTQPSPFEIFRYTRWGTGGNTSYGSKTIRGHSGTTSGSFIIDELSQSLATSQWYMLYSASSSVGWVIYIDTATETHIPASPGPQEDYTTYTYLYASWPTPTSTSFNGSSRSFYLNPTISDSIKTGSTTDGRSNIWTSVVSQYASAFKAALDEITIESEAWEVALDNIINFDYTIINQEAGSDLGKADTQSLNTNLNSWITNWKTVIHDSGSGATFSTFDSSWSNSNLDAIMTSGSGGLNLVIDFATDYQSTQSGYIASRRSQVYTLLGTYSKGTSEAWNPAIADIANNNTGNFVSGTLYYYRYNFTDSRLNREYGTLTTSYGAYQTYNAKLAQITALETVMGPIVTDSKYDITPIGAACSQDEEDKIIVSWESTKAAASYDIDRKEGLSGSWSTIASNFGYVHPGSPPDFTSIPPAEYTDLAYTKGYQEFGLSFSNIDDTTGLADDFTLYDFKISIDGATAVVVSIKGMDAQTWDALRVTLQKEFDTASLAITSSIELDDIRITSNKKGSGSSIALTAGLTNSLFTALSTTPDAAVAGTTTLQQGKAYYYRVKVNNGYNVVLGSVGDHEDKDWNSQSEYQTDEYSSDRETNGDVGIILWDEPGNLIASGVDEGLTPSNVHCRLEWEATPNAALYKIYRATSLDGGYALIDTTSNTYYEDITGIPGFVYYYKISSVAGTDHKLYDGDALLADPIEGVRSAAGVRGKKIWDGLVLSASIDAATALTLSWNTMTDATGYIVYKAPIENGQYSYLAEDDATEMLIASTSYIDAQAARQFFAKSFTSSSGGIASSDYIASHRYYFIVICTGLDKETTVQQYYISSPASGTWTCSSIASAIQTAINDGLNNANCELVALENPTPTTYQIRFTTKLLGVEASMLVKDGTFGDSLLPLLDNMLSQESGQGAYPAIPTFYRVEAVEIVGGQIVRRSEMSNIAQGLRPVI